MASKLMEAVVGKLRAGIAARAKFSILAKAHAADSLIHGGAKTRVPIRSPYEAIGVLQHSFDDLQKGLHDATRECGIYEPGHESHGIGPAHDILAALLANHAACCQAIGEALGIAVPVEAEAFGEAARGYVEHLKGGIAGGSAADLLEAMFGEREPDGEPVRFTPPSDLN